MPALKSATHLTKITTIHTTDKYLCKSEFINKNKVVFIHIYICRNSKEIFRMSTRQSDTTCIAQRVYVNGVQNALSRAQKDAEQACPNETRAEKLKAAADVTNAYVSGKRNELNKSFEDFNRAKKIVSKFNELADPTRKYLSKIEQENKAIEKDSSKYFQSERTSRRQFLDGEPQEGVYALPGLRTYDDKILLAFWVTYGVAIIAIMFVIFKFVGETLAFTKKLTYISAALLVAYGIAYYLITKLG